VGEGSLTVCKRITSRHQKEQTKHPCPLYSTNVLFTSSQSFGPLCDKIKISNVHIFGCPCACMTQDPSWSCNHPPAACVSVACFFVSPPPKVLEGPGGPPWDSIGDRDPLCDPCRPWDPLPSLEDPLEGLGRTVRCERYVRYALHHTHRTVCTVCTVCTARMVCTICIVCTVSTVRAVWDVYLLYLLRTVCTV